MSVAAVMASPTGAGEGGAAERYLTAVTAWMITARTRCHAGDRGPAAV